MESVDWSTHGNGDDDKRVKAQQQGHDLDEFASLQASERKSILKPGGVRLGWQGLTLAFSPHRGFLFGLLRQLAALGGVRSVTEKVVLREISGEARPGTLVAIMGPSGAGKTCLLNLLAQRATPRSATLQMRISGELRLNGKVLPLAGPGSKQSSHIVSRLSGFVPQDDILLPVLTARESLRYAASLRLPTSLSSQQREQQVEKVLGQLELRGCADLRLGSSLSGGERKRVSIAHEVLTQPALLFLDEPTTGLDSSTAALIVEYLRGLSRAGATVVCTIHAPSADMFTRFDQLLMVAKGRLMYDGPPKGAAQTLAMLRGSPLRRPGLTDPEYCLDALEVVQALLSVHSTEVARSHRAGKARDRPRDMQQERWTGPLEELEAEQELQAQPRSIRKACYQVTVLLRRGWTMEMRRPQLMHTRLLQSVLLSLFVGALFLRTGLYQRGAEARVGFLFFALSTQAFQAGVGAVLTFWEERPVFLREKASHVYATGSYFFAKSFLQLPFQIFFSFLFGTIGYWLVGLQPSAEHFFRFSLCLVLQAVAAESIGLLTASLLPHPIVGLLVVAIFLVALMLVTGFFINLQDLNVVLALFSNLSPLRWGLQALAVNEFTGLRFTCLEDELVSAPGIQFQLCPITRGEQVLAALSLESQYWLDITWSVLLFLFFRLSAFLTLRHAAPHRR
eukprot:gb/GEZN01002581.1/.p1 GENE.gb/GEZN01002581.1/~~gb/GEZN01002581.1/.p1  ORF type:complete len:679 (+),score=116.98 gb/GEZN01002581.1/:57-2093(+)